MIPVRKIYKLLSNSQRRTAAVLFGLIVVGMLFETLSIGMVIPAIAVMTQPDVGREYPVVRSLIGMLGNPKQEVLVIWGVLTLVGLYLLKVLFLTILAFWQNRFIYGIGADISKRLFVGYLRQPWTFHLQHNSAVLIRNVLTEASTFAKQGLIPLAIVIGEVMIVLGVVAVLISVQPVGAVFVIAVMGLAGFVFQRLTHRRILRWGEERQYHDGFRIRHLQQGLGGVKDIKLLGREDDFIQQYEEHNKKTARTAQRLNTVQELPRFMLEFLAMIGLALLVLIMLQQGSRSEMLLPVLGLFAAAAFRLMPSATRIMTALQSLRYAGPVIDLLLKEFSRLETEEIRRSAKTPFHFGKCLSLQAVSFIYPGAETFTLTDITLTIKRGASIGLVGSSGAGKSTLVDVILGLLPPQAGKICVDGVDVQSNLRGWQDQIGYVPQSIFLTDDSLCRNVAFGVPDGEIDDAAVRRALQIAQLDELVSSLPQGIETVVGERGIRLPGGQRQRIGVARALYHDPEVLVLDEATSALDIDTEADVMKAIKGLRGEKTILVVAHRFSAVAACDRLFRMEHGKIIECNSFEAVALGSQNSSPRERSGPGL